MDFCIFFFLTAYYRWKLLVSSFCKWNFVTISTKESSSIFTSLSPSSILSARDRLSYLIDKKNMHAHTVTSWPHIVASHYGVTCVASLRSHKKVGAWKSACKRWHLKKSARNMWYYTPRLTRYGIRDDDIIPSIIIRRESLRAISSFYLFSFTSLLRRVVPL